MASLEELLRICHEMELQQKQLTPRLFLNLEMNSTIIQLPLR